MPNPCEKQGGRRGLDWRGYSGIPDIGRMHDIGRMGAAGSVLSKQEYLDDDGFSLMKKPAEMGAEILSGMGMDIPGLRDGIRHHHER